jgi:phosphatidylglycerol---prolipoprotein diacylglyceryl transferase
MYPEIIELWGYPVYTYGVMLAIALITALFVAARLAKRDGLPSERMYDLGLWILLAGLLGSKLLLALLDPNAKIFSLDFLRSGGVFYGGFLGGLAAAAILIPLYKLNFWKVADAFAPGIALGQFFGRQGCFAAGCCWGKATTLPWGVTFSEKAHEMTGVPVYDYTADAALHLHPTQLYESFAMLAVFALLYFLHGRKRFNGQILILYMVLYPLIRFTVEFFRDDPRGDLFGLTTATGLSTSQMISLLVAIGAAVFLIMRLRRASNIKTGPAETVAENMQ